MALESNALCTLEDVKNVLNITGSTELSDTLIENLINRLSTAMESYCDKTFASATYTEYQDGSGADTLFLDNYPITSITSINQDSDWTWAASTVVTGTAYRVMYNSIVVNSTKWTAGRQNIKVVYVAGYATPPLDLAHACTTEVARAYNKRTTPELKSKSSDLVDTTATHNYYSEPFLSQTMLILNKYKKAAAL